MQERPSLRRAALGLAAALLTAPIAGCDQGQPQAAPQQAPPPTVSVSQPVQREIVEWDEYTGRFDAT